MDYSEALAYLESHDNSETRTMPIAGKGPKFDNSGLIQILNALGNPQHSFRVIHVTGTNGKGSVSKMIASFIGATDLSVGVFTSPHLTSVNERISWGSNPISNHDFARQIELIASVAPMIDTELSYFEILTVASYLWFSEMAVDVAVLEVGLLGRFDATNTADADVAVITSIGKDHTDGKGDWRSLVAGEKAGIIKPQSVVVLGDDFGEQTSLFINQPHDKIYQSEKDFAVTQSDLSVGGRLLTIRTPYGEFEDLFFPYVGSYQAQNLAIAICATEAFFDRAIDPEVFEFALSGLDLPGRFEIIGTHPLTIIDGFHNRDGAMAQKAALDEAFAKLGSWVLVIGLLGDRDPVEMLEAIDASDFDAVICTQPNSPRALPAVELAKAAESLGIVAQVVEDGREAVATADRICSSEDLILIGGSFYLVADVREQLIELVKGRNQ